MFGVTFTYQITKQINLSSQVSKKKVNWIQEKSSVPD